MATYTQTPNSIIINCSDAADRRMMIASLVAAGWNDAESQFPGMKLDPTGKPKFITRALAEVVRAGATPLSCGVRQAWEYRVLVQEWNTRLSEPFVMVDGRRLVLTGHGKPFTGREIDGPLWGDTVCYAYYAGEVV